MRLTLSHCVHTIHRQSHTSHQLAAVSVIVVLLGVIPLEARIQGVIFGSSARPAMLGDFPMTPFNPDPRPPFHFGADPATYTVSDVPTPHGGVVDFRYDLYHVRWGVGWTAWDAVHGPPYDIYTTNSPGSPTEFVEMDLPAGTRAIYFAASHALGSFGTFHAIANQDIDTTVSYSVDATHSGLFGFYVENPADPDIRHVSVVLASFSTMAIGSFGIYIPEPTALLLLAPGLALAGRGRR